MKNLGAAINGGGSSERRENDFYPTPPEPVIALLNSIYGPPKGADIWEPACGDGALARVLESKGHRVIGTDLIYRGYGEGNRDFILAKELAAPAIVTNPPFSLADEFVAKAKELRAGYLALLLKATYFHAAKRVQMFGSYRPMAVLPLTWRVDFLHGGEGSPTMETAWFVWGEQSSKETIYAPLSKESPQLLKIMEGM